MAPRSGPATEKACDLIVALEMLLWERIFRRRLFERRNWLGEKWFDNYEGVHNIR